MPTSAIGGGFDRSMQHPAKRLTVCLNNLQLVGSGPRTGCTTWNKHADRKTNDGVRYRPRAEWVVQRGTHETFIDEETAEILMQQAMPKRIVRRGPSGDHLLTGFLYTPEGKALVASGDGYYRAGKGRRVPSAILEAVVLYQCNEEVDSAEFIDRFVSEAKRAAADLTTAPTSLEAQRRRVVKQIANLVSLAEKAPESPALSERLAELEGERKTLNEALKQSTERQSLKTWLARLDEQQARDVLAGWMSEDGATTEERRAALAQIVDRIELDPTTGEGRVHYRVGFNDTRFKLDAAARELGLGSGVWLASPRGFEVNPGSPLERRIQLSSAPGE